MNLIERLKDLIPDTPRKTLWPIYNFLSRTYSSVFSRKHRTEVVFWTSMWEKEDRVFKNDHYRGIMLAMAEEPDGGFLSGKIVADFGCGPRGSLAWADSASQRIGIDVLADFYADRFKSDIISHGMIYVKSTEKVIPLPSGFVDVLFTLNAIDHVDSFPDACSEVLRILKPGGEFIGSFNLEEPRTAGEPQRLTEEIVKSTLLDHLVLKSYRTANRGPEDAIYSPFFEKTAHYDKGKLGFLWVRAVKPGPH